MTEPSPKPQPLDYQPPQPARKLPAGKISLWIGVGVLSALLVSAAVSRAQRGPGDFSAGLFVSCALALFVIAGTIVGIVFGLMGVFRPVGKRRWIAALGTILNVLPWLLIGVLWLIRSLAV